jgi:hypothetical protein
MGYEVVQQDDGDIDDVDRFRDSDSTTSPAPAPARPQQQLASLNFAPPLRLFMDDEENTSHNNNNSPRSNGLNSLVQSITSRRTKTKTNASSYEIVEGDDFADDAPVSRTSSAEKQHKGASPTETPIPIPIPIHNPRPRRRPSPATAAESTISSRSVSALPILRTASGRSIALRHPTPDLQTLQGGYTGNILQLEKTAEQLSMTSSIDDAIKDLHNELKRSDSRRSSLLSSQSFSPISRQVSNASSIVEVNSAARSGGFSPAGFIMSPNGSFSNGTARGRSASKSSRFGSRPEPELEGRPLDSFVGMHSSMSPTSPILSRSQSIAEQDEDATTITLPVVEQLSPNIEEAERTSNDEAERPTTSASTSTYEQAEKAFADFDGMYAEPTQQRTVSGNESNTSQRRASSGNRLSMARPQSYADPSTGQQMVYYPAPVPMMLNLPQKLSKMPSSQARNKRRSQVLNSIPQAVRQSTVWLPDVLEQEDEPAMAEGEEAQGSPELEYIPQHQRASMGGRRTMQDLSHLPPQLRANAFFEIPGPSQIIEVKEQSAVATLDSILDASAHAPVTAFTDHLIAGHLGAEVYGKSHNRHSRSSTQLLEDQSKKKRTSSFNLLLRGRRASSSDLLESEKEQRRATLSGVVESHIRSPIEEDDDEENETSPLQSRDVSGDFGLSGKNRDDDEESDEGQREDEIYQGAPTTLLAELQLRKQQAKQRTRPLLKAFPNGMHSTLLEMDSVAQVEAKTRKKKPIRLAWEDPNSQDPDHDVADDEDVPLAMLYANKQRETRDPNRPMGLMERREMEDNEPLSRRRDRLQGRPAMPRASTMMNLTSPVAPEEEGETLAERIRRLKEAAGTTELPRARPVSGDFASEMMSQFGGDLLDKGKEKEAASSPPPEEEETLGQRRKRLQTEREARAKEVGTKPAADSPPQRPPINTRRSMADILQAHPAAGAGRQVSYQKPPGGLLGLHEKHSQQRASTMLDFNTQNFPGMQRASSGGFKNGLYNDAKGGIIPPPAPPPHAAFNMYNPAPFPQPSIGFGANGFGNSMMMPFANPYAAMGMQMGYNPNAMHMQMANMGMLQMGNGVQPLNQGQIEMVERWRQSVMQ